MSKSPPKKSNDVGSALMAKGVLSQRQVELARRRANRQHLALHRAIIELNLASEQETYRALADLHEIPYREIGGLSVPPQIRERVPVKIVLRYVVFPVEEQEGLLTLAFADPPKPATLSNLRLALGQRLKAVLATPSEIRAGIERFYGLGAETIQQLREDRGLPAPEEALTFETGEEMEEAQQGREDASISKFVTQILDEALRLGATDIHFEPYEDRMRLRYRIDGILQDIPVPSGLQELYGAIVSRLKVMAGLNIAERRLPHDGRIAMRRGTRRYDLRVSILPTRLGETVCLRVLSRDDLSLEFERLGMPPEEQERIKGVMGLSQGMMLLTGPTGSGKTTTLYTALQHSRDEGRKIITVEDPVEYQMPGVSQIQVRPDIGLTFSAGLRSILRHDPDVVLIGEIRDQETAEIAVRASQTGHLVLSTLHTNDSPSAVIRLIDMGIEPFLVASSLICSIAQRLIRLNCRNCVREEPVENAELRAEMAAALTLEPEEIRSMRGAGCVECGERGYRGREAIYEFLYITDEMSNRIEHGLSLTKLREMARLEGWRPLREAGWEKVQDGITSVEEHQRVTRRAEHLLRRGGGYSPKGSSN
ncbi:MAG TPA: GspE/PulE family protein [Opitutales bacterium]|nr:GspE/PulE family protein [Opitutales bacterium]